MQLCHPLHLRRPIDPKMFWGLLIYFIVSRVECFIYALVLVVSSLSMFSSKAQDSLQSHRQCPQHLKVLENGPGIGAPRDAEAEDPLGQRELGVVAPLQENRRSSRTLGCNSIDI